MKLRPWARFLNVAVLKGVAVVRLPDDDLGGFTRYWLFQMAGDVGRAQVRLDCGKLQSLSSAGLSTLVALHRKVRAHGGSVMLYNAAPLVYEVFKAALVTRLMEVRPRD
jgi:anti-anti-sigma factor